MHKGELPINRALAVELLADQYPQYGHLPISRVKSSGTAHVLYRLGDELVMRLPRLPEFGLALERESEFLPQLAPLLPLAIPELVGIGRGTERFPCSWSILRWIKGTTATATSVGPSIETAERLGQFVVALRSVVLPGPTSVNTRGMPLASNDEFARKSIESVSDLFDPVELTEIWEHALSVPGWDGGQTWIHGDLLPGNLLINDGSLSAVIDFGECSVGNPTYDLVAGWWVFDGESRLAFRDAVDADADSWDRGRGWALSGAVGALAYYRHTNPDFAAVAQATLKRVLEDQ